MLIDLFILKLHILGSFDLSKKVDIVCEHAKICDMIYDENDGEKKKNDMSTLIFISYT